MSVSDDATKEAFEKMEKGSQGIARGMVKTVEALPHVITGVVFVIQAPLLTAEKVMKVTGRLLKNPKYSKQNVSIAELEKNSDVKKVESALEKDVMKHFDNACKKYGVTYTAVMNKKGKTPTYYVFFKGKETEVIEQCMKEAYKEYMEGRKRPRISIRAKLDFFRKQVRARDQEQQDQAKEKYYHKPDPQR